MEKLFDVHVHSTFAIKLSETIEIFKEEFSATGTEKYNFMSVPHHATFDGELQFVETQNVRNLFLKHVFAPNAYSYASLEHPYDVSCRDYKELSNSYLKQAEEYMAAGYDGMKMLEGYPSMRKAMKRRLDDPVYDKYYSFLEENNILITLHAANPSDYWDVDKASDYVKKVGRFCDETFPTKAELHEEVDGIIKKHPKLRLTLAHFGFMSYDIEQAKRWLSHENTLFDLTPGGEQLINMSKDWDSWYKFFEEYQDRIMYGSDFYAFPKDDQWETCFTRRPKFVRQFFETSEEHIYAGTPFKGVNLEKSIRDKIYFENAVREFGTPKPVNKDWLRSEAVRILDLSEKHDPFADVDMKFILDNI